MCCFSLDFSVSPNVAPVRVKSTQIFARGLADGSQYLVYSMSYASSVEVAMILPLPTPPNSADDAAGFIDLSGFPNFFAHMVDGFPEDPREQYEGFDMSSFGREEGKPVLKVHQVGSFEASFVPSPGDFARLDARFRLPKGVLERLPQYRDYGFAVFKLKAGEMNVHPMAFRFPRRDPGGLFFPTVHVHDGTVPREARFDHVLYCQSNEVGAGGWESSRQWTSERLDGQRVYKKVSAPARTFVPCERTQGIVEPAALVMRAQLHGMRRNADIVKHEVQR